jgi:hypothetical protein
MHRIPLGVDREVLSLVATLTDAGARLADLVADGALDAVTRTLLPGVTVGLLEHVDRVQAVAVHTAARVHESGELPHGHVSTKRWLQQEARRSGAEAKAVLDRAADVRVGYRATGEAWLRGQVSGDQVRAIADGLDLALKRLPVEVQRSTRAEAEEAVLAQADGLSPEAIRRFCAKLRAKADTDGTDQAAMDAYDDQQLSLVPVGDHVSLRGWLTRENAALLQTALTQVVDGWYRSGELAAEDGDVAGCDPDDPVARRHRRSRQPHLWALALAHLADDALARDSIGTHHGVAPRVVVTTDLGTLRERGGELLVRGQDEPIALPPSSVLRMLCDANVQGVLVEDGCRQQGLADLLRRESRAVLFVGREHRTVPPRLRRALEHRDRHCAFPGCRVNVSRCRAHHVEHWEAGGPTDVDNCVLLCERHHHSVHEGGWTVRAQGTDPCAPGYWVFDPPPRRPRP